MKKSKTFMFESQDRPTSFELLHQRLRPTNRKQIIPLVRDCEKCFGLNEKAKLWRERSCMGELITSTQLNVLPDPSRLCCLQKSSSHSSNHTSSTHFQSKSPAQVHIQPPRLQCMTHTHVCGTMNERSRKAKDFWQHSEPRTWEPRTRTLQGILR